MKDESVEQLAKKLESDLLITFKSPVIGGKDLRSALGYQSAEAFRQAISRDTVPVHLFTLDNRRGKFAFLMDIARWMADIRSQKPVDRYGMRNKRRSLMT